MITIILILLSVAFSLYAWVTPGNFAFSENALFKGYDGAIRDVVPGHCK